MSKVFHLDILTPDKIVYRGPALSLVVPAEFGYLGVLANHAPFLGRLTKGKIVVKDESGENRIFYSQSNGFLEVLRNTATILIDSVSNTPLV